MPASAFAGDYQLALPGYRYQFPRDHFNHPGYQTEWWYYTGNLKSADGHRFGFELTFFREGVSRSVPNTSKTGLPGAPDQKCASDWSINDIYLAHLALSDLDRKRFYHTQRVNRAGPGLAGASEQLARIWNGNWQVQFEGGEQRLQAIADDFALRFVIQSRKPPVINGINGVSQKAAGLGRASHYISFTRLLTTGSIELNGRHYDGTGTSWMDHEFFTHQLEPDQVGWDWLSLQLNDNTELMLFRIRHRDGTVDPFSAGTYVDANGDTRHLKASDFRIEPMGETWTSPNTGAVYPVAWHITVLSLGISVEATTPLKSQEIVSRGKIPSYWEGAITLSGKRGDAPLAGVGYLEMTGYDAAVSLSR